MKKQLLGLVASLLLAGSALADNSNKWYAGAGLGQSKLSPTASAATASLEDEDTAWKIYGGYKYNQYFAFELFYADLGESKLSGGNGDTFTYDGVVYNFTADNAVIKSETKSIGLNLVASYPVNEYFEPFAKIGIQRWDTDASCNDSTISPTYTHESDNGTDIVYGVGFDVSFTKNIAFRAEWERYEMNPKMLGIKIQDETDFLSFGLTFKF